VHVVTLKVLVMFFFYGNVNPNCWCKSEISGIDTFAYSPLSPKIICATPSYTWNNLARVFCAAGYYSPVDNPGTCVQCTPGHYCLTGAITPLACPPGTSTYGGSSSCVPCSVGYFSLNSGSSSCTQCLSGYMNTISGSSSCSCPVGYSCTGEWSGCSTTSDCCPGLQCRVGDHRCLTQADFEYGKWADNAPNRDGTVITPGCVTNWNSAARSVDCCEYPTQKIRVGDNRCLTQGDFEYVKWVSNAPNLDGTFIDTCHSCTCELNAPRYGCSC